MQHIVVLRYRILINFRDEQVENHSLEAYPEKDI